MNLRNQNKHYISLNRESSRSRSLSNVEKKINEIKEAVKNKNKQSLQQQPKEYIKFFIPVIISKTMIPDEKLEMGEIILEHYKIQSLLSENELVTIYEGTQIESKQKITIKSYYQKQISMDLAINEISRSMLLYEHKITDNILKIKDFFIYKNRLIVVEELKGVRLLKYKSRLPIDIVKNIMTKLIQITSILHQNGILHLGLNLNSISFVNSTPTKQIFVSGFIMAQTKDKINRLDKNDYKMNINYWSPEALLGLNVDEQTDVWSIGCILYELIVEKQLIKNQLNSKQIIYVIKKSICTFQNKSHKQSFNENQSINLDQNKSNFSLNEIEENIEQIKYELSRIQKQDPLLLDLLMRIFVINPNKRLNTSQLQQHHWFD